MSQITLSTGFAEHHRDAVIALFWQAFQGKLAPVMGPKDKALRFLRRVADPAHAISATNHRDELLGIAGYKTSQGSSIGGEWDDLVACYGVLGSAWRAPLLSLLERKLEPDTLLMDGIFVTKNARGQRIGTRLLSAIKDEARRRNLAHIRLDVINTNPRARALYEREGFIAGERHNLGPLRYIFGFSHATTMNFAAQSLRL